MAACQQRLSMGPHSRGGPGQGGGRRIAGPARCDMVQGGHAGRARSASEPSCRLAPRLDRQGQQLPWVQIHFIMSCQPGQEAPVGLGERVVVCSRAVNGCSGRGVRRAVIAAKRCAAAARRWRSRQGEPALSGQRRRARAAAGAAAGGIGSGGVSDQAASADVAAAREGQRPASGGEDFCDAAVRSAGLLRDCSSVQHEHSCQRFCSVACRLALRRVLDREARYRAAASALAS